MLIAYNGRNKFLKCVYDRNGENVTIKKLFKMNIGGLTLNFNLLYI